MKLTRFFLSPGCLPITEMFLPSTMSVAHGHPTTGHSTGDIGPPQPSHPSISYSTVAFLRLFFLHECPSPICRTLISVPLHCFTHHFPRPLLPPLPPSNLLNGSLFSNRSPSNCFSLKCNYYTSLALPKSASQQRQPNAKTQQLQIQQNSLRHPNRWPESRL